MKTLSSILLILNPICGFLMVGSIVIGGYWWLSIFPLAFIVYLIMIFYFKTHKEEFEEWKKAQEPLNTTELKKLISQE